MLVKADMHVIILSEWVLLGLEIVRVCDLVGSQ